MSSSEPRRALRHLIKSAWIAQAIHAAATLGIADRLAAGGATTTDLARAVGADAAALRRLLRALAALDLVHDRGDDAWALTPSGALLRDDVPGSLRAYATLHGRQLWSLWGRLPDVVRSGRAAGARGGFDAMRDGGDRAEVFGAAMAGATGGAAAALMGALRLPTTGTVMDVGGGHGRLLSAVLQARPGLRGVLVDLPYVVGPAQAHLQAAGVADRCDVHAADVFASALPPADVVLLKSVLHDWSDARCAIVLARCRDALGAGGRLLVIERLLPDRVAATDADRELIASDLTMLIATDGRERTAAELTALLVPSGFAVGDVRCVAELAVVDARSAAC